VKEELIQKSPFFGGRIEFLHEKGRERTLSFDEERKYLKAAGAGPARCRDNYGRDGAAAR